MAAKPKPRLTAAARAKRDTTIIDLFLAGWTQRAIAAHPRVKLAHSHVGRIVRAELERATKDHVLRNQNAMIIYLSRIEMLMREALAQAEGGDLKAVEVARRLLREQADVYGLADTVHAPIPPMNDHELEEPQLDELARYREQRKSG